MHNYMPRSKICESSKKIGSVMHEELHVSAQNLYKNPTKGSYSAWKI